MQFFTFCHQILSIRTISANIGSCPRTTLPLPHGLPLGSRDCFLSFVVILIMAAFYVLHEGTAFIYKGRGKTRNEMFIPSGLKCLRSKSTGERTWNPGLQVKASVQARENDLLVQVIDTRAVRGNKSARQRGSKFTYHSW